jgi:hypothetical protein
LDSSKCIAAVLDRDLNPVTTIREKGDLSAVVFDKMGNAYLGTSWGFVIKHSRKAEGTEVPRSSASSPTPGGTSTRWGWGGKPLVIGQRLLVSGSTAAKGEQWAIYAISGLPTQKEVATAPTPADTNAPASTAQSRAAMQTPQETKTATAAEKEKPKTTNASEIFFWIFIILIAVLLVTMIISKSSHVVLFILLAVMFIIAISAILLYPELAQSERYIDLLIILVETFGAIVVEISS